MGIDISGMPIHEVGDKVIGDPRGPSFAATMRSFGIRRVEPPELAAAKQTGTVQRFKVHLHTDAGLDHFTKWG